MMNWKILNRLHQMLRVLMDCDVFMSGKCVVLMGNLTGVLLSLPEEKPIQKNEKNG